MTPKGNNFSSRERKTIILLSAVMVFALGVMLLVNDRTEQSPPVSPKPRNVYSADTTYKKKIAERHKQQEEHYRRQAEYYRLQEEYYQQKSQYYREEIGRLRKQNAQRARQYNSSTETTESYVVSHKFSTPTSIDPNAADSATLCSIPGIGKGIATSILHQRQRLGGFYDVSQLMECRYFTEDLLPWFSINTQPALRKININKASFAQLVSHPYISKAQTQDIHKYIRLYGNIRDAGQLAATGIFTPDELTRVLPYIEF